MRSKEFLKETKSDKNITINIPITITIPSGGDGVDISTNDPGSKELPPQPVNVFPLQQELELLKHQEGKRSKVLNQILDDNGAYSEDDSEEEKLSIAENFDKLLSIFNKNSQVNR